MKCPNCGSEVQEGALFCMECGENLADISDNNKSDAMVKSESVIVNQPSFAVSSKSNNSIRIVLAAVVIVFVIAVLGGALYMNGIASLKNELLRDWSRVESGSSGSLYRLELDFSETEIDYNFRGSYIGKERIETFKYKVISPSKIRVEDMGNEAYTIEFNDDKTMMTITPALTRYADDEVWFNLD